MHKPNTIKCSQDIPIKLKEKLESEETLAANERILLFTENHSRWRGWHRELKYFGLILTNIRFFQFNNGKVTAYIFLNDVRTVKHSRQGRKHFLIFQLVNGQERQIRIYNKISIAYFLELFQSILLLDVNHVAILLLSDKERLRNDIWNIIKENINIEELFITHAEKLWDIQAEKGEKVEDLILRYLSTKKKWSQVNKLWENSLHLKSMRKDLAAWSKEKGLRLPENFLKSD